MLVLGKYSRHNFFVFFSLAINVNHVSLHASNIPYKPIKQKKTFVMRLRTKPVQNLAETPVITELSDTYYCVAKNTFIVKLLCLVLDFDGI